MTYGRWCESVSDFDDQSLTLQACGFLSHIAHDRIVVSSGRDSSSEPAYCGSLLIPIECVKRVRLLRDFKGRVLG